jgi:formylmethanofuran dehydrogenase subunit B
MKPFKKAAQILTDANIPCCSVGMLHWEESSTLVLELAEELGSALDNHP